jgi:hypothetical protein
MSDLKIHQEIEIIQEHATEIKKEWKEWIFIWKKSNKCALNQDVK